MVEKKVIEMMFHMYQQIQAKIFLYFGDTTVIPIEGSKESIEEYYFSGLPTFYEVPQTNLNLLFPYKAMVLALLQSEKPTLLNNNAFRFWLFLMDISSKHQKVD